MAFDPVEEDSLRLILEALRREGKDPVRDVDFIRSCAEAYRTDASRLVRTDRDRSFHLTAQAAELLDYQVPFMQDEARIQELEARAEGLLAEAASLDEANWDARRMLVALQAPSNDAYVEYLLEHAPRVEAALAATVEAARDEYDREFCDDLARRPYLRWLAATAAQAVIAGRYRLALETAETCLALSPADAVGARHSGMLALGKLEADPAEIFAWRRRHEAAYRFLPAWMQGRKISVGCDAEHPDDAWSILALMSGAYRSCDYEVATDWLRQLLSVYRDGAAALHFQAEFPEALFCRPRVEPGSLDELVLAVSECTPLLQEGLGAPDNAGFAVWVATHELVRGALPAELAQTPMPPIAGGVEGGA